MSLPDLSFVARIDRFCQRHPGAPREAILASRLLFHTARALRRAIGEALAPFDLSMEQYLVLSLLSTDEDVPSSPSALCEALDATRTQMTRLLDPLEARGLLGRRPRGEDRRSLELSLSAAGRRVLDEASRAVHAVYGRVWGVLAPGESDAVVQGLRRLHAGAAQGGGASGGDAGADGRASGMPEAPGA